MSEHGPGAGFGRRDTLALLLAGLWGSCWIDRCEAQVAAPSIDPIDHLVAQGRFKEALRLSRLRSFEAEAERRRTLILSFVTNDFAVFDSCRAAIDPKTRLGNMATALAAESWLRRSEWNRAADAFLMTKNEANSRLWRTICDHGPAYAVAPERSAKPLQIPFWKADPLPVVLAEINGQKGKYILDTGANFVVIDPGVAASAGIVPLGAETGVFAGGKTAPTGYGCATAISIGGCEISNIPVHILPTTNFAAAVGEHIIAGVIGTALFSRFRTTIDYAGRRLILASRTSEFRHAGQMVEFAMAGTHYILAEGELGETGSSVLWIDTGLAGAAVTAPEQVLVEAGALFEESRFVGKGGGGAIPVRFGMIDSVALGPVRRKRQRVVFGAFPDTLSTAFGIPIRGLVSHAFFRGMSVTLDFSGMHLVLEGRDVGVSPRTPDSNPTGAMSATTAQNAGF